MPNIPANECKEVSIIASDWIAVSVAQTPVVNSNSSIQPKIEYTCIHTNIHYIGAYYEPPSAAPNMALNIVINTMTEPQSKLA